MKRALLLIVLCALPLPLLIARRPDDKKADDGRAVAGDDKLVEKVNGSIKSAIEYLKDKQDKTRGTWNPVGENFYTPGYTSLAMLALMQAGVPPGDPAIQRGLKYLRKEPPFRTYVVGLQTMVFCLAGEKEDRPRIERNVKWLEESLTDRGWGYVKNGGTVDNSNSQYALLGLHEAIQAGFKVKPQTLEKVRNLYMKTQVDGGWAYQPMSRDTTMTMTTAGLCNLIICGMDLAKGKAVLLPDGSAKNCGKYEDNPHISGAVAWLGGQFPSAIDDAALLKFRSSYYALYGFERAGRLTGQRFFGGHDWYEVGCQWLVKTQKLDGSWVGSGGHDSQPVIATSFALLFLAKGRTPVLVSKMAYGSSDSMSWNNKRNDMKHLTEYCGKALFKNQPLAWQVFDMRTSKADTAEARRKLAAQLRQTPIVFLNGHHLAPSGREVEVLKEYLKNGGFLLAENCCGKKNQPKFDRDFRNLVGKLVDDGKLEELEPEHPIWRASGKYALTAKDFPLLGVKQGCKTVVVYSPEPLAGYWEENQPKAGSKSEKAFQLGANIVAYATGLEAPKPRLSRAVVVGEVKEDRIKRGFVKVAQLRHEGDWRPAPRAMSNLMAEARKAGLDVMLKPRAMFPSDDAVRSHRFLYMHGRGEFKSSREDLKALRFRLTAGGLLLADACCGDLVFDKSFRQFIKELFPDGKLKLEPVPTNDKLYSKALNGVAIDKVTRRTRKAGGKTVLEKDVPPALEGVRYKGRWVVLYSKVDIGCALEKHASPECVSHEFDSALRLGRAALLYALTR